MEEQDENMNFTIVDPLKVEVNADNPWSVDHASAFLKYCCPECEYKNGTLKSFEDHALQNHENAKVFFANGENQNLQLSPHTQEDSSKQGEYKAEMKFSENLPSESFLLDMPSPVILPQPPRKVPKKLKRILNNIEQVMNCEICSVKMENEASFKSHILETHMDGKLYCCPYCDAKYKRQGSLIYGLRGLIHHIDTTHPETGEKKLFCDECKKGFIHKTSLDYHKILTHSNQNVNKCELCETEYQTLSGFNRHMAINHSTGEEPVLMCDKCEFTALHKTILQRHVLQKHDIKSHKNCPCCDFKTPQKQKLYVHIDNNHPEYDEKKFFCEKCGRGFIYELTLTQHSKFTCKFSDFQKSKNGKKKLISKKLNIKCDYCSEILRAGKELTNHYKRLHPNKSIVLDGIKKFKCDNCEDIFFSKHNFERHCYVQHGIETKKKCCQECFMTYTTQHNCQKKKVNSCDHCNMIFSTKPNLKSHVLSVHEKRLDFACEYCGKTWATLPVLRNHVKQTHTQHVVCDICNKKISNPIELRRHKVFVHKETQGAWLCEKCPKRAFFSQSTFEKHIADKH